MVQVYQHDFFISTETPVETTVFNIGKTMMLIEQGGYALPFEVISILLLAAMVGCIVIALREQKQPTSNKTISDNEDASAAGRHGISNTEGS